MLSFAKLSLSNLNINGRGNKTGILIYGSERLEHTFNEPARCLFGPSAFGWDEQAMRQGIPFELTQEMSEFFTSLDVWAKEYIEKESERLLGKQLTGDHIDCAYCSCVTETSGKSPLLKFKLSMPNSAKPCRIWNRDGSQVEWPQYLCVPFKMRIKISHLCVMGVKERSECGFVCLLEGALLQRIEHAFPSGQAIQMEE